MNDDFVAEILRATGAMRAGDPAGVNDIVQAALAAGGLSGSAGLGAHGGPYGGFQPSRTSPPHGAPYIEGEMVADQPGSASAQTTYSKAFGGRRLRKPLSEVLETLTAGRKGLGLSGMNSGPVLPSRAPDLPMPEGAEFRACATRLRPWAIAAQPSRRALVAEPLLRLD